MRKEKKLPKKCSYCGGDMICRGSSDALGSRSWKCHNKRCGRTVWQQVQAKPPVPLVPVERIKI